MTVGVTRFLVERHMKRTVIGDTPLGLRSPVMVEDTFTRWLLHATKGWKKGSTSVKRQQILRRELYKTIPDRHI